MRRGVEDFYKGRTSRSSSATASAAATTSMRALLAQHLGKHIPGNPTVVPQKMPGAGSISAANYIYSVARQGRHP